MDYKAIIKLLVALAVKLEIPPEELALVFRDNGACQAYFDKLVALTTGDVARAA